MLVQGHILLVEERSDARERTVALERAGHRCTLVSTAEAALELLRARGEVDVLVTDVALGRDDRRGLRLLSELRSEGCRVPIVLLAVHADVALLKRALNEGADHLLERPFAAVDLVAAIARLVERDNPHVRWLERARLTGKEQTVARYLIAGLSSGQIAALESNSPRTIRQHVSQIYAKCEVSSRAEFLRAAYQRAEPSAGGAFPALAAASEG